MKLVTWNIQWGKGCDGRVDLARIVRDAKALADADVFCFQEVSCGFEKLDGGVDQSAELVALLPGYAAIFRPAIESTDGAGRARRFGNMTFTRLPVMQVASHLLPWPWAGSVRSMRRQALEVTVRTAFGPLRVVNAHLEYHSASQREAQIARLLDLQEEASISPHVASTEHLEPYVSQTLAPSSVLCGDFNFDVSDPQHAMLHNAARGGLNYRDAWTIRHPGRPHDLTCGLYDREQWAGGPDCRDFIFVSEDLAARVRDVVVDGKTAASDHQPMMIELAD
jgi:endonuclease/exonuclease/phosphatase family metal-dependent hydrolase